MRPAIPQDAEHLARLANMAGEGLPLYFWAGFATPNEDPWQIGFKRAQRDEGSFSYKNALIAGINGEVAAMMVAYLVPDESQALDDVPAIIRPLAELENEALGTFYVNILATYPAFRRMGVGTRLLEHARGQAGAVAMSIIVSDGNHAAMRLYQHFGYNERARRPIAKIGGWSCEGDDWVLLIR